MLARRQGRRRPESRAWIVRTRVFLRCHSRRQTHVSMVTSVTTLGNDSRARRLGPRTTLTCYLPVESIISVSFLRAILGSCDSFTEPGVRASPVLPAAGSYHSRGSPSHRTLAGVGARLPCGFGMVRASDGSLGTGVFHLGLLCSWVLHCARRGGDAPVALPQGVHPLVSSPGACGRHCLARADHSLCPRPRWAVPALLRFRPRRLC